MYNTRVKNLNCAASKQTCVKSSKCVAGLHFYRKHTIIELTKPVAFASRDRFPHHQLVRQTRVKHRTCVNHPRV